ncbi:Glutamyl-tRNA(Gln) amidotransferase subunit C, mitochondrial [Plasmodiophora brassicae]|uniref:Glutamyl-tRNA(Gln) amidotransferase subunit C, mitochondrial n=1 Tax=Plasmodiophora brassicae TaxID=37360 RepID=A0A3P3YBG3_PLABS|nr:unnamed protein product [Plasmodiophora brassicae]
MGSIAGRAVARALVPPSTWSLRQALSAATASRATPVLSEDERGRLQAMCKVGDGESDAGIAAVIEWTAQVQNAPVPDDVQPVVSPLDFWGHSLRLTEDAALDPCPHDDILQHAPHVESSYFKLPRSPSGDDDDDTSA